MYIVRMSCVVNRSVGGDDSFVECKACGGLGGTGCLFTSGLVGEPCPARALNEGVYVPWKGLFASPEVFSRWGKQPKGFLT
jgi:hypothetical protein